MQVMTNWAFRMLATVILNLSRRFNPNMKGTFDLTTMIRLGITIFSNIRLRTVIKPNDVWPSIPNLYL